MHLPLYPRSYFLIRDIILLSVIFVFADFGEFLKVIEQQKDRAQAYDEEDDMIDAFVACGGNRDKTGHVERSTLVSFLRTRQWTLPELTSSTFTPGPNHQGRFRFDH